MKPVHTNRLQLVPLSRAFLDALLGGRRDEAQSVAGIAVPEEWPDEHDRRFLQLRLGQVTKDPAREEWLPLAIALRRRGAR